MGEVVLGGTSKWDLVAHKEKRPKVACNGGKVLRPGNRGGKKKREKEMQLLPRQSYRGV